MTGTSADEPVVPDRRPTPGRRGALRALLATIVLTVLPAMTAGPATAGPRSVRTAEAATVNGLDDATGPAPRTVISSHLIVASAYAVPRAASGWPPPTAGSSPSVTPPSTAPWAARRSIGPWSAWPPPRTVVATGWWPPTAASSPSATPASTAPWAGRRSTGPWWAWRPRSTVVATGWWPPTVASSPSATPDSTAPWAGRRSTSPWWAWPPPRTVVATGWWPPTVASSRSATPDSRARPARSPGLADGGHVGRRGHRRLPAGGRRRWGVLLRRTVRRLGRRTGPAGGRRPSTPPGRATGSSSSDGGVYAFGGAPFLGAVSVPPLVGEVVTIDPGHNGGNGADPAFIDRPIDGGDFTEPCDTAGTTDLDGYPEHAFNFDVATRLATLLTAGGATVVLTRSTDTGVGPCVDVRAAIGNLAGSDAAISIHGDGGPTGGGDSPSTCPCRSSARSATTAPSSGRPANWATTCAMTSRPPPVSRSRTTPARRHRAACRPRGAEPVDGAEGAHRVRQHAERRGHRQRRVAAVAPAGGPGPRRRDHRVPGPTRAALTTDERPAAAAGPPVGAMPSPRPRAVRRRPRPGATHSSSRSRIRGLQVGCDQEVLQVEGDQRRHVAQLPAHVGRRAGDPQAVRERRHVAQFGQQRAQPAQRCLGPGQDRIAAVGRRRRADPRPGPGDRGRRPTSSPPGSAVPPWRPRACDRRRARPRWRFGPRCRRRRARRHPPLRSPAR